MFGSSSPPAPQATPPVPKKTDSEILAAEEAEKDRIRKMMGRSKTILTSGEGVLGGTETITNKKSLLGGG